MAVEERQLLGAMRRVVGGIEIDRDPVRTAVKAPPVPLDDRLRQLASHLVERLGAVAILEARDRGLRGERVAVDGIAAQQELVNRVVREPVGVIGIRIAAGEAEDPLGQQVPERVPHLPRLPIVDQATREAIDQAVRAFGGVQQDRAAIGTRVRLVEGRDQRFVEEVRKQNGLWYRVAAQAKASVVEHSSCGNGFVPCGGFCVSIEIGPFVNYSG